MDSTVETIDDAKSMDIQNKFINTNLISLKFMLFIFFGGMGCLLPFLPLHMLAVGLTVQEIGTISMIAPVVAIIGPMIAGPLADRVAAARLRSQNTEEKATSPNNGRYLRVMIAVCCVFSALFYSLLLLVPAVERIELPHELRPAVRFSCDDHGAVIHQERCRDAIGCHRWSNEDSIGALRLEKCNYACYPFDEKRKKGKFPPAQMDSSPVSVIPLMSDTSLNDDSEVESSGELGVIPLKANGRSSLAPEQTRGLNSGKWRRYALPKSESPHVCYGDSNGRTVCHVFTESRNGVTVNVSMRQAINSEDTNDWCVYPVAQFFDCRVPREIERSMVQVNQTCLVECLLDNPYDSDLEKSILAESHCRQVIGNEQLTFWMYLAIRSLADIFPTAAVALIDAALVIATRETSTGRGDVGRQLAFGSLGFAAFGPLSGYLATLLGPSPAYYAPIVLHVLLVLLAACICLSANDMPLSPPEWWWHTRNGMLALPMSAVRKYGGETVALLLVLVVMGTFWSAMDSYLSIHLVHLKGTELSIGLALTVGALPAVLFLWKSEHLVDYCGHSNLLITAFIIYIVRFTGLSIVPDVWWALISEALELFTLGMMWVTTVLYFRHLIPRQMTASGQALPVIAHFCIGRAIGAVIGACVDKIDKADEVEAMRYIYQCMAIAAAATATFYFALYHGIFKPRCHAQTIQGAQRQPSTIVQAMNGNGNYTPLRVYHNGMGKKGQFRY
ncbi:PREDICTED: uncharacterized protein LOC105366338 isoform X2 [Ceratosolen solmsi marchali]|uniref:Uncharacterized protein LOC105366338 isoform X2 n=1 Tax=Ceratosolen solmsi marchali TaxID=326594 RepID=A0AAJ6YRV7_9HYME|nr:PREDICTED: uncharacterized protein LOC105366338 isoform X2 [Ceratosolen solmsi marchali]